MSALAKLSEAARRHPFVTAGVALVAALCLVVVAAYILLQTESGRAGLARYLESALSRPGQEIAIGRIDSGLPAAIRIDEVTVADAAGTWLTVRRIALDWSPLALFRGRLQVATAGAGEITIARRPAAAAPADAGSRPGLPPLDIAIERLTIDALRLEEPVLGAAASLRAEAALGVSADGVKTTLEIVRTDAVAGHARAVLAYDPATGSLELQAALSEPSGGLTARLLDLRQLPAIELSLGGEGTAADWRGRVTLEAEDFASLTAAAAVAIGQQETRIALDGTARPGPSAGTEAAAILGPETAFALSVRRPHDSGLLVVTIDRLHSAAIEAEGTTDLDLAGGRMRGRLHVATRESARLAPLTAPVTLAGIRLDASFEGPLDHPAIALDVVADDPRADAWSATRLALQARLRPDGPIGETATVGMDGRATVTNLRSPVEELTALLGDSVTIDLGDTILRGLRQLEVDKAAVTGGRIRASLTGTVGLDTGALRAGGEIEVDDLSPMSKRAGRPLAGSLRSTYTLTQRPAETFAIGLAGTLYQARLDLPVAESLLGPELAFAGRIDRAGDGRWSVSDISLSGAGVRATGAVALPPGATEIVAQYSVRVSELNPLRIADPARPGGYLEIQGQATGPAGNPALEGTATLFQAAPGGFALDRVAARYVLPAPARALSGRVEITATSALLPELTGRTDFAVDEQILQLKQLQLAVGATNVDGRLAIPLSGPPLSGSLTVAVDDLDGWSAMAGRKLAGRLQAEATLSADGGRQQVSLDASIKAFALDDAVRSRELSATAKLADALGERRMAISLTSGPGKLGAVQLSALSADLSGTPSAADFALRAKGEFRGPLELEGQGTVQHEDDRTRLTVARLSGQAMGAPVVLQQPARAEFGPAADRIEADLALGGGTARASLRRTPKDVSVEAAIRAVPLILLWPGAPPQADKSTLDADAVLSGRLARPDGSFRLSIAGLAAGESETAPQGLTLTAEGQLRNQRLVASGRLVGLADVVAEGEAAIPLRLSLAPVAAGLDETAPASGRLTVKGPIEPVLALAALDRHRMQGTADIQMALSGPLRDPRITGHAELNDGRYENLDTGTILTDLRIRARPSNETLTIDEATAGDGNGGRVNLSGTIALGGPNGPDLALDAVFERARLIRRDELTAVSSGTVSLRGNMAERKIAGQLDIGEAEIRLIGGTTAAVVQIEVEETGTPPAGQPAPPPPRRPSNTHLDLKISAPKRLFVRGRGLESEWGGDLMVTGTTAAPRIQGDLFPLRGRYDFLGKIFTLQQGSISFVGADEIDPALDLSAERRVTDLTAIIRITGTARRPQVALESIPELPQDEVLSRILFNKSTGRLSAMEGIQLGQAVAAMTGATNGGGIMDFSRRLLNLDVLEVKRTEESAEGADDGQTSVEAGRYVTDKVYIGVESGADGGTGATVEIEVSPRVKIEGDVGQKEKEKIGIKWKRDY